MKAEGSPRGTRRRQSSAIARARDSELVSNNARTMNRQVSSTLCDSSCSRLSASAAA